MAYDKGELEKIALKAIKKNKISKVSYVAPYLPCSLATFYNLELEKLESIKEALFQQRINRKKKLVEKWEDSDNATLNIAAFKLLADDDELERLNGDKKTEVTIRTVQVENREKGLDDESED